MKKLSEILGEVVERGDVLQGARAQQVLRRWPEVVGATLAEKSAPDRYSRGTLWVAATGSAWAQELRLQKDLILAKLNRMAGDTIFEDLRVGVRPPRKCFEGDLPPVDED